MILKKIFFQRIKTINQHNFSHLLNKNYNRETVLRRWVNNYPQYRYIFCGWLHCWLETMQYIWFLSPPHPQHFGSLTLTVHYCSEFHVIKMDIPLFICMKGEQQTVNILYGLMVNWVPKCIEGCQYRVKTVLCCNRMSTNGLRCSKMYAKVLSTTRRSQSSNWGKQCTHGLSHPKTFYFEGKNKIVWWWNRCIIQREDYVEKQCTCKISFIHSFIHSLVFSLRGRAGRNQSPVMWPVWLWHTASWASSWG